MKFLFRWAFRFFVLLIVLVVALVLLKDVLVKALAENRLRAELGMEARIGKLELGLLSPRLTIENLKLFNPAEFGGSPFLDAPELHFEWEPGALAFGKLHFKLVRLSVAEMNIVESRDGRTNLLAVVGRMQRRSSPGWAGWSGLGVGFDGIDVLNLTLGKVRHTSLRQPGNRTEYILNLRNEMITDVNSLPELTNLLMRVLFRNGITISSRAPPSASLARKIHRPIAASGKQPPQR